jgi:hypothetical protein
MKVLWTIIAVVIVLCSSAAIAVFAGNGNDAEVRVEEATNLLSQAVAYAQARSLDKLYDIAGSEGICRSQWELAGGEQAVPDDPPEIVDTYLLSTVHLKNGGKAVGGRVLVLEGVDGLGEPYRTEFFVFRSRDSGLNGLAVTNVIYWSGYGIAQPDEDGLVTTALSPSPEVEQIE